MASCSPSVDDTAGDPATDNHSAPTYEKISADDARQMMDASDDYIILDVRTELEYREARIENALLIPHDEVADRAEAELPNKDQAIFVYCRAGVRSAAAAETLASLGYTNVYDIGGITDWPYPTVSGQ